MDTGVSGESRVLAVDGDREGGGELSRLLTGAGYNVRRAADGLSALGEITPTICPDLVLAAVRLPWLRGVAVGVLAQTEGARIILLDDAPPAGGLAGAGFIPTQIDPSGMLAAVAGAMR